MKKNIRNAGNVYIFSCLLAVAVLLLSSGVSYAAEALLTDDTYTDVITHQHNMRLSRM